MKNRFIVILLGLMILTWTNQVQAKWWIFGKSEDTPEINSLFIANMDIGGVSEKSIVLDRSNLEGRNIVIKGFVTKATNPLAIVKISMDGGQTWEDVEVKDNSFIYQFEPEENKEYTPQFKVMDTAGTESDVKDLPQFTLSYKPVEVSQIVEETLRAMIDAYIGKSLPGFTRYLSDSFIGDQFAMEEAIQSDFRRYDNINMDIIVQQVVKSGNQALINFEFEWRGIKKSDGSLVNPSRGKTSYTFQQEGNKYKLLSMSSPIIFGISQASEVDTSTLSSVSDATSTTFSSQDVYGGSLTVYTATLYDGQYLDLCYQIVGASGDFEYAEAANPIIANSGAGAYVYTDWGPGTLEEHTSVPAYPGTAWQASYSDGGVGKVYGVYTTEGKYGIFQITGQGADADLDTYPDYITIRYKFQTDGTTNLP